jgi:hypothetical protein
MLDKKEHLVDHKFPWMITSLLYFISFGPVFGFPRNLYWDDWTMFDPLTGTIREGMYAGTGGGPWRTFIETEILKSSPVLFRITSFLCFFFAGYFLFRVFSKIRFLSPSQISAITLLFMLIPANSARISLITNTYALSYFLFFLAWFLFEKSDSPLGTTASFVAFFLSYSMIAFTTFTILPILLHIYISLQNNKPLKGVFWVRLTMLALLPVAYLILRQVFWPTTGGSAIMYQPQILGLLRALLFTGACSTPLLYGLLISKWRWSEVRNFIIPFGLFALSIGAFPYMVGGHLVDISDWLVAFIPNFSDWSSRHQLLLPLGISLILGGSLGFDSDKPLLWNSAPAFSTLIAFCIVLNVTFAQEYFLDGKKQEAIMAEMVNNYDLRNSSSILIDDTAVRFNARGRLIRSYEWERMLEKVFGENSRKVSYLQFVNCSEFEPDAILHISAPNGRLESTLRGKVVIDLRVEKINPCSN